MTRQIEVSSELYDAIQELKSIFSKMNGEQIEKDEDVLEILIGGFIESLEHEMEGEEEHDCKCGDDCDCEK